MKKATIMGLLGLGISAASTFAQGVVFLDNYTTSGPTVTYGVGSGGTVGSGIGSGWTVGMYYAPGTVAGAAGNDIPGGSFVLATGAGSSAAMSTSAFNTAGEFSSSAAFLIDPTGAAGATFSIEVTAFNGTDYASSLVRGHSAAFTLATSASTSPSPVSVGSAMQGFSATPVPEPATFALAGIGAAAMLVARRRK